MPLFSQANRQADAASLPGTHGGTPARARAGVASRASPSTPTPPKAGSGDQVDSSPRSSSVATTTRAAGAEPPAGAKTGLSQGGEDVKVGDAWLFNPCLRRGCTLLSCLESSSLHDIVDNPAPSSSSSRSIVVCSCTHTVAYIFFFFLLCSSFSIFRFPFSSVVSCFLFLAAISFHGTFASHVLFSSHVLVLLASMFSF